MGSATHNVYNYNLYKPSVAWTSFLGHGSSLNYAQWQALGHDVNSPAVADPLFTNALGRDYTLTSSSPAKWVGVNVGLTTDYTNGSVHNPPSIGAYEYGSSSQTNPVLYPPKNLRIIK